MKEAVAAATGSERQACHEGYQGGEFAQHGPKKGHKFRTL